MKGFFIFKATVCLSGWAVAAWLLLAGPLEPIALKSTRVESSSTRPSPTDSRVGSIFNDWAADPALAGALLGFCVLDEHGEPIIMSALATTALCPASALKTVTTAAALEMLGDDFRFESFLHSAAEIDGDGVLAGDLVFTGYGDPTFSSEDLERFATAVALRHGLKRVKGRLVVDASSFPDAPVSDHWNWGDIGNAYGAGAFGVNLDHNRMVLRFQPGSMVGDPARLLDALPMTPEPEWANQVSTGPVGSGDRVMVYSEPYGRRVTLRGTVPAGVEVFSVSAAIPDPPKLVEAKLKSRLTELGVRFDGQAYPAESRKPSDSRFLVSHLSVRLPEIIDHLHKVSDNLEAQCLFVTMGLEKKSDPAEVLRSHWVGRGVAFTGLRLIDGSGLARANMIRPLDLAMVNHLARRGPYGERFRQSLTSYLDGSVRSKLGAMSGVRTEVGFLTLEDGREVTFALLANGLGLDVDFWPLREKLLRKVASELSPQ
jgi:D-alanyl-D-alanine carboxypeptidase/D-alanyl-D-alanine-endopeptidase (penicillin-binding protein 4)